MEPGLSWSLGPEQGTGLPPYLITIGAGAAVLLHGIWNACSIVLAWTGEASIALGHDVDIHRTWQQNQSVDGRCLSRLSHFSSPLL